MYLHDVVIEKEASDTSQEHLDSTGPNEDGENLYTPSILDRIVKVKQNRGKEIGAESRAMDVQNEQGLDHQREVQFSLSNDTVYMDRSSEKNTSTMAIDPEVMREAKAIREKVAGLMNAIKDNGLVALPDDIEGNTYIANSSYDGTEENTTICPRSRASEAFTDVVSEYLGRPLTVQEQIYISQDLQGRTLTPECVHCYVATDRKAYSHLKENGIALICTMGDGQMERSSDISAAFDLQERVHEESGQTLWIAGTSYRAVSFQTFEEELTKNKLDILKLGVTDVEPDYWKMMYAVVRKC